MPVQQMALLPLDQPGPDPLREELAALDPDGMAPLDALTKLYELHRKAKE